MSIEADQLAVSSEERRGKIATMFLRAATALLVCTTSVHRKERP